MAKIKTTNLYLLEIKQIGRNDKMQSKHNKLIVSNSIFEYKINSRVEERLVDIKCSVIDAIDKQLKENNSFKSKPFLWLGIVEKYGDYEKIDITIGKIDKRYGDLEINIFIPKNVIEDIFLESDEEIFNFYQNQFMKILTLIESN